jgi:catechol 2,3-dioxygenase-like lactoylglutathione lyase family enzyme
MARASTLSGPEDQSPTAPALRGVLETALYCDDLERVFAFYHVVLGAEVLFHDERLVALDAGTGTVLLLFRRGASAGGVRFPGGFIPPHDGAGPAHLAFAIAAADLATWEARLVAAGVTIESRVAWPRGGESLYIRDPEGHSIEWATPGVWPAGSRRGET